MIIIDIPAAPNFSAPNFSATIRLAAGGGNTGQDERKPQTRPEIKNAV